ncbi:MAG: DUF4422 domain-containing protein, partial [Clostridiales bacterium]|nr:DUF4422 domain-containing protein [Clostridiales bacterium]
MNVRIIIAAHKLYQMPSDEIYLPVHAGSAGKPSLPYQPDNTGDNISGKNPEYCELTCLYWAWKNLEYDYLGLAHYRRHFTVRSRVYQRRHAPMDCVLTGEELSRFIPEYKIIVPEKRRYFIETLYSHYAHTHYAEHLDYTREIIEKRCPEYIRSFDRVMKMRAGHMFNMCIMEKSLMDEYCEWLFGILDVLEAKFSQCEYSDYHRRYVFLVSEI